jgi:arginyl-tRNA synthetase
MIKPSKKKMGIGFDVWFSENSLYKNKEVDKAIEILKKEGLLMRVRGRFGSNQKIWVMIKTGC